MLYGCSLLSLFWCVWFYHFLLSQISCFCFYFGFGIVIPRVHVIFDGCEVKVVGFSNSHIDWRQRCPWMGFDNWEWSVVLVMFVLFLLLRIHGYSFVKRFEKMKRIRKNYERYHHVAYWNRKQYNQQLYQDQVNIKIQIKSRKVNHYLWIIRDWKITLNRILIATE